jgi:hypothetical protein
MKFSHNLVGLAVCLAAVSTTTRAEPPDLHALVCTVARQEVSGAVRVHVRFENHGAVPLELPPGPHLILYVDSSATERFDLAARMDRIQRAPIVVPPGASTEELFAVGEAMIKSLGCSGAKPAAAAMYFYKFSQQPQSRCLLRNFDFQAAFSKLSCPTPAHSQGERQ